MKPMLAGKAPDLSEVRYPVLATPKIDGIRCLILEIDGRKQAVSRKFKPIPNDWVREWLEDQCPIGFDGELVVFGESFNNTSSGIMRKSGRPHFQYQVFDVVRDDPYEARVEKMIELWEKNNLAPKVLAVTPWCSLLIPDLVTSLEELEEIEHDFIEQGHEGVMIRDPVGPYKFGRSTTKEGWLLKIKRFQDSEAIVIGFEERMHNANEAEKDNLGHTKRSSHKANKIPTGMLGSLIVRDIHTDVEFSLGTGFSDDERRDLWNNRDQLCCPLIVKYKSQPSGRLNKPRFPVFLGFRSALPW